MLCWVIKNILSTVEEFIWQHGTSDTPQGHDFFFLFSWTS